MVPVALDSGNLWSLYFSIDQGEFYEQISKDTALLAVVMCVMGILLLRHRSRPPLKSPLLHHKWAQ